MQSLRKFYRKYIGKKEQALLFFLILFGFFLRAFKLGESSFWLDESFTLMQVKGIRDSGLPLLGSGFLEKKDLLLPYLLTPFAYFFDLNNEFWMRSVSLFFGTISIPVSFLLGNKVFNKKTGLIFAFLMTFSYWQIAWSRQVRGYEIATFFVLLTFLLLFRDYKDRKQYSIKNFLIIFPSLFFAITSKTFAIFLVPSIFIYFILKKKFKMASILVLLLLPILFYFKHLFLMAISSTHPNYLLRYLLDYFWFSFGIIFIFSIIGLVLAFKDKSIGKQLALFSYVALMFLFFSNFVYVFEKRYLFLTTPIIFLYAAYFLERFAKSFSRNFFVIFLLLVSVVLIDMLTVKSLSFSPKHFYQLEYFTPQPDFASAFEFVEGFEPQNILVVTPYPALASLYLPQNEIRSLPISYTGRMDQSSVVDHKEYYSGKKNYTFNDIESFHRRLDKLEKRGQVGLLVLDEMAKRRIAEGMSWFEYDDKNLLFYSNENDQEVFVYILTK